MITLTFAITVGAPITIPYDVITNTALLVDAVGVEYVLVDTAQSSPESVFFFQNWDPEPDRVGRSAHIHDHHQQYRGEHARHHDDGPDHGRVGIRGGQFHKHGRDGRVQSVDRGDQLDGRPGTGETAQVQFTVLAACPITGTTFTNHTWIVDPLGVETPVSTQTSVLMPDFVGSRAFRRPGPRPRGRC